MTASGCARVVLVVDDDDGIRGALADLLAEEGYAVRTAADGHDALATLRAESPAPCVILLDLMMPRMNGAQFHAAQQRDPTLAAIPVVVISADVHVQRTAARLGTEWLKKPLRFEQVLELVGRHCG